MAVSVTEKQYYQCSINNLNWATFLKLGAYNQYCGAAVDAKKTGRIKMQSEITEKKKKKKKEGKEARTLIC